MKYNILTLALLGGCALMAALAVFLYIEQDREPPVVTVKKEEIAYTEGDSYEGLLEGVSAEDDRDGDLTSQIFVNRIVQTKGENAVVYYSVMDSSNNVGTATRMVRYIPADGQGQPEEAAPEPEGETAPSEQILQPNGGQPAMALAADTVTINVGEGFDPVSMVQQIVDDKDDVETLYQRIAIDGGYDANTPGNYELWYYVTDMDGNTSEPLRLVLVVQ